MEKQDRVILVQGGVSKWYDQAIFIVNKNAQVSTMPVDFIQEAENIINEYLMNDKAGNDIVITDKNVTNFGNSTIKTRPKTNVKTTKTVKSTSNALDVWINTIMLVCCVIMAGIVLNLML